MKLFAKQLERTIATHCIISITLFINKNDSFPLVLSACCWHGISSAGVSSWSKFAFIMADWEMADADDASQNLLEG